MGIVAKKGPGWAKYLIAACFVTAVGLSFVTGPLMAQTTQVRLAGSKVAAMKVTVGKSRTISTDVAFADLVVGDPEIADVMPLTDKSLYVLGKKPGITSVSVYDEQKKLVGVIEVESALHAARAQDDIQRAAPNSSVRVDTVNGRMMLSGTASDGVAADRAAAVARQYGGDTPTINRMRLRQPQQVMLEVRFIEASRTAGKELGVAWNINKKNSVSGGTGIFSPASTAAVAPVSGLNTLFSGTPFGSMVGTLLTNGIRADVLIQALEERGLARRLAEPNLVALSGQAASFLAGGEYPIPVAADNNRITVDYKRYGVGLTFLPTVLEDKLINLRIEPEVSQLDPTNRVAVGGGIAVPALTVRRAQTTVELRDGQSFAIAGLLQAETQANKQQLPWLADVPIIGALFRSSSFERSETDLVIIVTPRLVKPARPGEKLRTPLDNTAPGNDIDLFLNGKGEVTKAGLSGAADVTNGPGHILDIRTGAGNATR